MKKLKKWLNLDKIYDIHYSDQIIRSIIKTTYAKRKLNILSLMLITVVVRLHIDALLGFLLRTHNIYFDFCLQIILSITLVIKSGWIYQTVVRFDREVYSVTKYLVNNYSDENYRIWKRNVTLILCFYLLIILSFIEIDSLSLKISILQYLISYFIIDLIEKKCHDQFMLFFHPRNQYFISSEDEFEIVHTQKKPALKLPIIEHHENSKDIIDPLPRLIDPILQSPLFDSPALPQVGLVRMNSDSSQNYILTDDFVLK